MANASMEPITPTPGDGGAPGGEALTTTDASSRQRSCSPWAFKLSTRAVNRCGEGGSGVSTPVLGTRFGRFPSAGAGPLRQAAARATYETAVLTAVRKQIDTFEEKVGSQIGRMQQQEHKLREAAVTRLEEKMHATEGQQPKVDRRIAELKGNFQGLSDEMQSQIRRVDLVDERLWEFRRQIDEDFRGKFSELNDQMQKAQSSSRVMFTSLEESQKKLNLQMHRIDLDSGDRLAVHEETREGLLNILGRLEALEERSSAQDAPPQPRIDDRPQRSETREEVENNSALLTLFDRRMGDMMEKVERVVQDSIDLHQSSKQHEVQLSSLRTHLETREEQMRKLTERVETSDTESRLDQFRRNLDDDRAEKVVSLEKIELMRRRIDDQELSFEGLRSRHDQLLHGALELTPMELSPAGTAEVLIDSLGLSLVGQRAVEHAENGSTMEDYVTRLSSAEARLATIDGNLSSMCELTDMAPRVGELVSQLTEIVPKVIEHESRMSDFDIKYKTQGESLSSCIVAHDLLKAQQTDLGKSCQALLLEKDAEEMLLEMSATLRGEMKAEMKRVTKNHIGTKDLQTELEPALSALRDDIGGIQNFVTQVTGAQAKKSVQVAEDLSEALSEARRELGSLRTEVGGLNELVDTLRGELERNRGAGGSSELPEGLVKALQQDEEIEREKQQTLLTRIDELCEHIAAVDSAVSMRAAKS